jgi:hypothetical protein
MEDTSPIRHISEIGDVRAALARWAWQEQRIPIVPCDSPIEDIFLWEFKKVAAEIVQVRRQEYCRTAAGAFRLDFVLSLVGGGIKLGIECDGRNFHSEAKDSQRDAAIVAARVVDRIYRLRGRDIHFHIHDTLHLLSELEPWLFSERGQILLDQLSEREAKRADVCGVMQPPGFRHGIMRTYLERPTRTVDDSDYLDDPDYPDEEQEEDYPRKFPTLICWTQRDT